MASIKTVKTLKTSKRTCEVCQCRIRESVVGVFDDDGRLLEEYGLCREQKCRAGLAELTIGREQALPKGDSDD